MSGQQIRVGIAGCGQIARRLHIPSYMRSDRASIAAIYNHSAETAADLKRMLPKAQLYTDYDAFLGESEIQALSICTPNSLHCDMTIKALSRGISVLVEKPMAVNLDEAGRMIESARSNNTLLMVGQSQRYYPSHKKARDLVHSGVLGTIHQVRATLAHAGPIVWSPRGQWFVSKKLAGAGGVIADLGIHKVDLLHFLTDDHITRVYSLSKKFFFQEAADNFAAVLEFESGAIGTVSASWTLPGKSVDDTLLAGEQGALRIDSSDPRPLVFSGADGKEISYDVVGGVPQEGEVWMLDEIEDFLRAVSGEIPNPIPGEEGYRSLEVTAAIQLSARTGKPVELPLQSSIRR
jgi:UDP-N-acetylglucosamine 3-dehydrogenase